MHMLMLTNTVRHEPTVMQAAPDVTTGAAECDDRGE